MSSIFQKIKIYAVWAFRLWHPFCKTAYLLGTPTHDNIGDIAIAVAEIDFLKKCGYSKVINITIAECWSSYGCIAKLLPPKTSIFLHGGGNMGDIYDDENLRRTILPVFSKHRTIIFPQSIYYRDTESGNLEKERSVNIYNSERITIFAREEKSFEIMSSLYPKANVILSPDIVLSMRQHIKVNRRAGILLCFRNDSEKSISNETIDTIERTLRERGLDTARTSMIYHRQIPVEDWDEVVAEKMNEIGSAKLLITDRLHGMIFAALTQTPCIVFGNNHHKVQGVYQWIKPLDYIRFVDSAEKAYNMIDELLQMEECGFHFDLKEFDILKEYANNRM